MLKTIIPIALILVSCDNAKDSDDSPKTAAPTVDIVTDRDVNSSPPQTPVKTVSYTCGGQIKAATNGPDYTATIDLLEGGARNYYLNVLDSGTPHVFVVKESYAKAAQYSPINSEPLTYQSSDVLFSMPAKIQANHGLSQSAQWQLNLKTEDDGKLVLTLSALDQGEVLDIGGGVSYCVKK